MSFHRRNTESCRGIYHRGYSYDTDFFLYYDVIYCTQAIPAYSTCNGPYNSSVSPGGTFKSDSVSRPHCDVTTLAANAAVCTSFAVKPLVMTSLLVTSRSEPAPSHTGVIHGPGDVTHSDVTHTHLRKCVCCIKRASGGPWALSAHHRTTM